MNIKIEIYLDSGVVYFYEVSDPIKGREHAHAIITTGYRHTTEDGDLEWFPPHRVIKVKVKGGAESSLYKDGARAT